MSEPSARHRCPYCETETCYQSFSGGREWYCGTCDTTGPYPQGEAPRRVQMLADGRTDELRAEMTAEMERRYPSPQRTAGTVDPLPPIPDDAYPSGAVPLPEGRRDLVGWLRAEWEWFAGRVGLRGYCLRCDHYGGRGRTAGTRRAGEAARPAGLPRPRSRRRCRRTRCTWAPRRRTPGTGRAVCGGAAAGLSASCPRITTGTVPAR